MRKCSIHSSPTNYRGVQNGRVRIPGIQLLFGNAVNEQSRQQLHKAGALNAGRVPPLLSLLFGTDPAEVWFILK